MQLKEYQQRVVEEVMRYLQAVVREREEGNARHASKDAWERQLRLGTYYERANGLGEDYPNFTIKAPTGAGKTVLATQVLGAVHQTILQDRNGAGLVLWVVPSSQIYRDTLRRLSDRNDWYRIMLEHALSRRIEVWEKTDIARLTPTKLRDKGKHLESNPDTRYKRDMAALFEKVGHQVTWQQLGEDFKDHVFRFQILDEAQQAGRDWNDALIELLAAENGAAAAVNDP